MEHRVLAIMGSPASGKTMAAIKLAQALAFRKKNVVVVFCHPFTPTIPTVVSAGVTHDTSLGALFTAPSLTQKQILDACVPVKENGYISLLGYREREHLMHFPKITKDKVLECFVSLRYLADYIILDCSTAFEADQASLVAMDVADQVLFFTTSNLKGLAYYESHAAILQDNRFWPEKKVVIGNQKVGQDWEVLSGVFGGTDYVLPYTTELERQENELQLFCPLLGAESGTYQAEINRMVRELFLLETGIEPEGKAKMQPVRSAVQEKKRQGKNPFSLSFRRKGEF
ncbi:MAG: MinD/ParA family ATP-binding protein [Lachnospiraceae bacterium]